MKVVMIPIDVLAWTDKDGSIHPIRFRMEMDDGSYATIKINKVISSERIKQAGEPVIIYRCQSIIDYIEKIFELRYLPIECKWVLWKI